MNKKKGAREKEDQGRFQTRKSSTWSGTRAQLPEWAIGLKGDTRKWLSRALQETAVSYKESVQSQER